MCLPAAQLTVPGLQVPAHQKNTKKHKFENYYISLLFIQRYIITVVLLYRWYIEK